MFSRVSLYRSILGGQSNTTGDFKEVYFLHILYILFDIFYLEVNDELDSVSKNGPFAKLCTQIVSTTSRPISGCTCCHHMYIYCDDSKCSRLSGYLWCQPVMIQR